MSDIQGNAVRLVEVKRLHEEGKCRRVVMHFNGEASIRLVSTSEHEIFNS